MNDNDVETALRDMFAERAHRAPSAGPVAARILEDVYARPARERELRTRSWRTWTLPLVAAGAVAAVAAALIGVDQLHSNADHSNPIPPATRHSGAPTPITGTSTVNAPTISTAPAVTTVSVPGAAQIQLLDLTFVGHQAWALGSASCNNGSGGQCTAMVHSADDGATWTSLTGPPAHIVDRGCADPCVTNVRFATDKIGYVYSQSALFMTLDGGASWTQQSGGAVALETLDNTVVRVVASPPDCTPPGCLYTVETAAIGSATWHATGLQAHSVSTSAGVGLTRTGSTVVLAVFGHTAGGGSNAEAGLYISHDDGQTWTPRSEPCVQQPGVEVDTTALASAADGTVAVLCTRRDGAGGEYPAISRDGGVTFASGNSIDAISSRFAIASRSVVVIADEGLIRSGNAGIAWNTLLPGKFFGWLGFESGTVGHAISEDGRTVWRTDDAGLTWTGVTFG